MANDINDPLNLAPMPLLDDRGLPHGYRFRPDLEVTPRQVKAMRDAGEDFLLVDCRTPMEQQIAKIEGATLVPLQVMQQQLSRLESCRHKRIVVYCHHGGRSLEMALALRQMGFTDVRSMAGGIDVWATDVNLGMNRY